MKNHFSRLIALLLALALCVGLLPTALAVQEAQPAKRVGNGFSYGASGTYVLAAKVGDEYYAMPNQFSTKISGVLIDVVDGYVADEVAADYSVTLSYNDGAYTISNGEYFLKCAGEKNTNLGSSDVEVTWTIGAGVNGSWRMAFSEFSNRGLVYRASDNQFGAFAVSNATGGSDYYDIEILPIGTVEGSGDEVFYRVTSASDITSGRYVFLVEPTTSNASYSFYSLRKLEDDDYYALQVVGTSLTSRPNAITASEGLVWTLDGNAASLLIGGNDGNYLYQEASTTKLEYSSSNKSTWRADYVSSKEAFTLRSEGGYYLSFRDDLDTTGGNDLPLCAASDNTSRGNVYFHIYKAKTVTSSCAHNNKETTTLDPSCTEEGSSRVVCEDCGALLSEQTIPAAGHTYRYSSNFDYTHTVTCKYCDLEEIEFCEIVDDCCAQCNWQPSDVDPIEFTLVTSEEELTEGNYVLIVAAGGANPGSYPYYALTKQAEGTTYVAGTGMDLLEIPESLTITNSSLIWTLTGDMNGISLTGDEGMALSHTNNNLHYAEGTASVWMPSFAEGTFTLFDNGRYLGLRDDLSTVGSNGNPRFRCNSSATTSSYQFYLFRQVETCAHERTAVSNTATCTVGGTRYTRCADCGKLLHTEISEALGHNANYIEGIPATCTEEGASPYYYCTYCGLYFSDVLCSNEIKLSATIVAPLGHNVVAVGKMEATCGTEGIESHYYCAACGCYFTDAEAENEVDLIDLTIPALGHDTVYTPATPAGCVTDGNIEYYYCEDCGHYFADAECTEQIIYADTIIPSLNHSVSYSPVQEATCTETGYYAYYYCATCDVYYSDEDATEIIGEDELVAPALGHDIHYTSRIDASCSEPGMIAHYYCLRCDLMFSDAEGKNVLSEAEVTIPTTEHNYQDGSCTDCGNEEYSVDYAIEFKHSLNLASDITINFVVAKDSLASYDSFYLECIVPVYSGNTLTGTKTVTIEPELRSNGYYYFPLDGIISLQMNNEVEATLYMERDGQKFISQTDIYSIAEYAYGQLNNATAEESLKRMCANLLQYGAAAQLWKEYRTDALVDANMTEAHRSYLINPTTVEFQNNNTVLNDISNPIITWGGKALRLDTKIVVRFVMDTTNYTGSFDDLSLRVTYQKANGQTVTVTVDEWEVYNEAVNYYSFNFDALMAAELRTVLNAAIYCGDTQVSPTMVYSVDSYGNGKTGTLLSAIQAMIAYSDTAYDYFSNR